MASPCDRPPFSLISKAPVSLNVRLSGGTKQAGGKAFGCRLSTASQWGTDASVYHTPQNRRIEFGRAPYAWPRRHVLAHNTTYMMQAVQVLQTRTAFAQHAGMADYSHARRNIANDFPSLALPLPRRELVLKPPAFCVRLGSSIQLFVAPIAKRRALPTRANMSETSRGSLATLEMLNGATHVPEAARL